jgi:apolipoprotein N-acyltransferase
LRSNNFYLQPWAALLLSAASGVSVSFCFWPYRTGFLAFVVLVPFILASGIGDGRGRYLLNSFVFGFAYFMGSLYWIAMLDATQMTMPWLRVPAAVVLCLYLALFMLLMGWLARRLVRIGIPYIIALAAAWATVEYLRSLGPLGFPWASLGYSMTPYTGIAQTASVIGTYGLGGLVVVVNGLAAALILRRRWYHALALALVLFVPIFGGRAVVRSAEPGRTVRVALIQPDVSGSIKWNETYRDTTMAALLDMTLASPEAQLIVWPETAVPFQILHEPLDMDRIAVMAERKDAYLLVGCPDYEYYRREIKYYNSAFMMSPDGIVEGIYRKIHLVPFGEMFPFEDRFDILKRIELGEGNFSPGTEYTVFDMDDRPFGVAICFESIYPGLVADLVRAGARFIVNITNDEWFGPSIGPSQHAQMAVMRAVEFRVGVARCANTGISMIVDPYGRVTGRTSLFTRAILAGPVEVGTGKSIYARIRRPAQGGLLVGCLALAALSYVVSRTRKSTFPTRY